MNYLFALYFVGLLSYSTASAQEFIPGPTSGSGGLPVRRHEVTIAGQPALIMVGKGYDPAVPTHLAYYLHGDEGGYRFFSSANSPVGQLVDEEGWIYVAPQAPEATERVACARVDLGSAEWRR